jgi:hypothetical protein
MISVTGPGFIDLVRVVGLIMETASQLRPGSSFHKPGSALMDLRAWIQDQRVRGATEMINHILIGVNPPNRRTPKTIVEIIQFEIQIAREQHETM